MPSPSRFPRSRRRGLTLTEVIFATAIGAVVSAGLLGIFIQALRIYDYDDKKLQINRHVRDFTVSLTESATFANYALIFPDFSTRSQTVTVTNPDTGVTTTSGVSRQVEDGQSGDLLVLVYVDPTNDARISRLVGYYRAAPATGAPGPVRRFELSFNPSSASSAISLLPALNTINTWPEVIELSEGLSDGRLFHNFYGRSVMVNGQIIQGTGRGARLASNTYNFTISPRG
jgi:prepilin-type N-terminal cleavage/methylation domain-containing protein